MAKRAGTIDVPDIRVRAVNKAAPRADGEFVLYWMIAFRRPFDNFSLDRAVHWSRKLGKPLVILEALRVGYKWACDRFHQFVIEGMHANAKYFDGRNVLYYPYLEPEQNAGKGLIETLAKRAAVVVTDDFPCFFLPTMISLVGRRIDVRLEAVDSNGILPMRLTDKLMERAYSFRSFVHKNLVDQLKHQPSREPVYSDLPRIKSLPKEITAHWQSASMDVLSKPGELIRSLAIDHSIPLPKSVQGGWQAAEQLQKKFINHLDRYAEDRNDPDSNVSSGLSPYLHFGHISPHRVLAEVIKDQAWTPNDIDLKLVGKNQGWWGMSPSAEAFLDQLLTWRELGYNRCCHDAHYDSFDSLPEWAKKTLLKHAKDRREFVYSLDQFAKAETHDEIWNAAQRQLVREGTIHNYLRMLWGKKILEWTSHPREALDVLIELNNRYAIDGRNPNSYTGIFWTLGRFDRAWGPERPIFGTIRYMSSESTRRKIALKEYLKKFGDESTGSLF